MVALALLLIGSEARAQDLGFASDAGAAGGTRAGLDSMSAPYFAPATLALESRYQIAGGARIGPWSERTMQAGAIDSTTGPVTLGLLAQWVDATPPTLAADLPGWRPSDADTENPVQDTTIVASLATGQPTQGWALGVGGSWRRHITRFGGTQQAFDAILSAAARTGEQLVWSITATDLLPLDDGLAPAQLSAGASWRPTPSFALGANLLGAMPQDQARLGWNFGVDGTIGWFGLRAGAASDPLLGEYMGAVGVGIHDEPLSLDYAIQVPIEAHPHACNGLSLRLTL